MRKTPPQIPPSKTMAQQLLQIALQVDHIDMLAAMSRLYDAPVSNRRNSAQRATLPDGSALQAEGDQFCYLDVDGNELGRTETMQGPASIPVPLGPVEKWPVQVRMEISATDAKGMERRIYEAVAGMLQVNTNLRVHIEATMGQRGLAAVTPSGHNVRNLLGRIGHDYKGPRALRFSEAYHMLADIAAAVNRYAAVPRQPRAFAEIQVGAADALLNICSECIDLNWQIQPDVLDGHMVCRHAPALYELLTPV